MNNQYRAVVIGCGLIGGQADSVFDSKIITHAHAYHNNKNIKLIGCCDTNQSILDSFKKKWGETY